jgi:putative membrane-bound dehydrogenase-like protein
MKSRIFPLLALLGAMLLSACGGSGEAPAATATTAPPIAPTSVAPAEATATTPPATSPTAAAPTTAPTVAAPAATAPPAEAITPAAAGGEEPALTLRSVPVETDDSTRTGPFATDRQLNLPPGFHVRVYATGLAQVRWLGLSPDGLVYATLLSGRVVTLPDTDKNGVADSAKTFADNLPGVHGIAFKDNGVYVATESQIVRLEDTNKDGVADKRDVLAGDLPSGGGHSTRTLAFGPDGKLYVSAGSSCNVCVEQDPKRAAISRYSADGTFEEVFASGLRNAVGLVFHPVTGELWATDNGRDNLGDNIPPETIYNVKEGTNYGWPYCYGDRVPDKSQNPPAGFCDKTGVPAVKMQAHSAPLGLAFYTGNQFPPAYQGDLFVAFHGSWNRSEPTGYKVVRVRFKDNQPDSAAGDLLVEDFATGWRTGGDVWGRPVDPMVAPDGSLLLTDDKTGTVYDIYYQANAGS